MSEQNYTIDQTAAEPDFARQEETPQVQPFSRPASEKPTGDMQVKTPYDYLREALEKEVYNEPIRLEVPNRPGIYIEYDTNIDSDKIELWRKSATLGNRRQRRAGVDSEMDTAKFMALVVYNQASIFLFDGQEVYLDAPTNSKPLNFFERETLTQLTGVNALTEIEMVRSVFRNDAHIISAGGQITEAAGYGEELEEMKESPTQR